MKSGSLSSRTILITRSPSQSGEFRELLEEQGARVLEAATIEIRARPQAELDPVAGDVSAYDWLLFTSANAVRIFLDRCRETGSLLKLTADRRPRICAVGPATRKAVEDYGLQVDLIPEDFRAEGVLSVLREEVSDLDRRRLLLPVASKARPVLPDGLRELGADLTVLPVYDTVPPSDAAGRLKDLLSEQHPDLVAVTSSSTARNFVSLCEPDIEPRDLKFAAIGPITAKTCRELGLEVAVEADVSTVPGLVNAIVDYFHDGK